MPPSPLQGEGNYDSEPPGEQAFGDEFSQSLAFPVAEMGADGGPAAIQLYILDREPFEMGPAVPGRAVVRVEHVQPAADAGRQAQAALHISHGRGEQRQGRAKRDQRFHGFAARQAVFAEAEQVIESDHAAQGVRDDHRWVRPVRAETLEFTVHGAQDVHGAGMETLVPHIVQDLDDQRVHAFIEKIPFALPLIQFVLQGGEAAGQVRGAVSPEQFLVMEAPRGLAGLVRVFSGLARQALIVAQDMAVQCLAVAGGLGAHAVKEHQVDIAGSVFRHEAPPGVWQADEQARGTVFFDRAVWNIP